MGNIPPDYAQAGWNLNMPGGAPAPMPSNLNQQVAGFTPEQQAAFGNITGTAGAQQPFVGGAEGMVADTMSGKYLNPSTNPYLRATYDQAAQAMTDAYKYGTAPSLMATAQGMGGTPAGTAYGDTSSQQRYELGQNLANLGTGLYGGNYANERGIMANAPGMVPSLMQASFVPGQQMLGVGSLQQQQQQTEFDTAFQNAMRGWQLPRTEMDQLGSWMAAARGPAGESATRTPNRAGALK